MVVHPVDRTMWLWDPDHSIAESDDYRIDYVAPNGGAAAGHLTEILADAAFDPVWAAIGVRHSRALQTNARSFQRSFEDERFAHEPKGFCATLVFLAACVCQRLNTDRVDDVTDALSDWVSSFGAPGRRMRLRFAVMLWIRRCYYARDYADLMRWIGVRPHAAYAADDASDACGVWRDDAGQFCSAPAWRPYTLCETHARRIVPDLRESKKKRRRPSQENVPSSSYPRPPVAEWIDAEAPTDDERRVVRNPDERAQVEVQRRRPFFPDTAVPIPGPHEFEWGPREKGPDWGSFRRPDPLSDDDADADADADAVADEASPAADGDGRNAAPSPSPSGYEEGGDREYGAAATGSCQVM